MKKIKIVDYTRKGKKTRYEYLNLTKFQVFKFKVRRFFRKVFIVLGFILAVFVIYQIGGYMNPKTIYTKAEVIKEVPIKAPVLDRIAICESHDSQYDKNGQILVSANKNGSVDIGKYQINNAIWGKQATGQGYNLMVESDNEAMAQYLYTNDGTSPWIDSQKCWQ